MISGKADIYKRFGEMTTLHAARDGFNRYNFKLIQLILGSYRGANKAYFSLYGALSKLEQFDMSDGRI